jgi:hypothetical protein
MSYAARDLPHRSTRFVWVPGRAPADGETWRQPPLLRRRVNDIPLDGTISTGDRTVGDLDDHSVVHAQFPRHARTSLLARAHL